MPTFREATARTVEGLAPTWRNAKHTTSWRQTLEKYAFPVLADLRVDQIERQDVLRALQPIWTERRETARRVRQRIRKVLEWCQAQAFVDINMAGEVKRGNRSSGCLRGHRSGAPPSRHASPLTDARCAPRNPQPVQSARSSARRDGKGRKENISHRCASCPCSHRARQGGGRPTTTSSARRRSTQLKVERSPRPRQGRSANSVHRAPARHRSGAPAHPPDTLRRLSK